jgi:dipeptidyl aminopeptidase/acylaminoacyl peptidase
VSGLAPYGTWVSPLSAADVAAGGRRLGGVSLDGDHIYWLEGRPDEGGRNALVRRGSDGEIADVTPSEINVRSRVHEYGGGAYLVTSGAVYCSNFADQRVYRIRDGVARPVTTPGPYRYADFEIDARRERLICVREDHTGEGQDPVNALVAISIGLADIGGDEQPAGAGQVLVSGADFYSTPRLSADGSRLTWLSWNHPCMPWDGTELWVAQVGMDGVIGQPRRIAGGADESIYQPGWSPDGALYYVSDRDGWWQIYRADVTRSGRPDASCAIAAVVRNRRPGAEFGRPQWVFGTSTWACAGPSQLVVSYTRTGRWHLAAIDVESGEVTDLAPHLHPNEWVAANATHAVLVAGASGQTDAVVRVDIASGRVETIRAATLVHLVAGDISVAEAVEFPTAGGQTSHAFFYPPRNRHYDAPAGESPPLVVMSHGGPTSAARSTLDLKVQYWTSRGFAVADVNYGGSSGYGRAYRRRLNGQWGRVDVADVVHAVQCLAGQGRADGNRAVIRGGSAGGYTTLAALTCHPEVFKAGASYYGVSDLEALALDTHKFESRYLHSLVGPYPEAKDTYRARSPIHAIDKLACPLILFQGLEDRVVPPGQSQLMADAVRAKGLPVAYLAFEGEQHGFRQAATIIRSLEAELYFYGAVFGFRPADAIPPVPIDNLRE